MPHYHEAEIADYFDREGLVVYGYSSRLGYVPVRIGDIVRPYMHYTRSGRVSRRQWRITNINPNGNYGGSTVTIEAVRWQNGSVNHQVINPYYSPGRRRVECDLDVVRNVTPPPTVGSIKPYYSKSRPRYAAKRAYIHAANT